jgi:hypothetical protein
MNKQVWHYFASMHRHISRKMLSQMDGQLFRDLMLYGQAQTSIPTAEEIDAMLVDWRPNRRCRTKRDANARP